jgi:hypothetical protein
MPRSRLRDPRSRAICRCTSRLAHADRHANVQRFHSRNVYFTFYSPSRPPFSPHKQLRTLGTYLSLYGERPKTLFSVDLSIVDHTFELTLGSKRACIKGRSGCTFVVLSRHLVFSCRYVGLRSIAWEVSPVYLLLCTGLVSYYPVSIVMQDLVNYCSAQQGLKDSAQDNR